MNKIICPTDFSPAANNAVEYAAELCRELRADLELISIQFLEPDPKDPGETIAQPVTEILNDTCRITANKFNIKCTSKVVKPGEALSTIIAKAAKDAGLVVMGTNGMDEAYEYFFGTYSYEVSKKAKCPVLIVPTGYSFTKLGKTVVAWDYEKYLYGYFTHLGDYRAILGKDIALLHVSEHRTDASKDVFRISTEELKENRDWDPAITFKRIEDNDPIEAIDEYMQEIEAKLLVLNNHHSGIWPQVFHGNLIKTLCNKAHYPILVIHER